MRLEGWAEYVPPPGSKYRIHYVPDRHNVAPDLNAMTRALDARPGVAVKAVDIESEPLRTVVADVITYVGDASLLQTLGSFLSDSANFWRVDWVERTDDKTPGALGVTVGRITDSILDPIQDIASATEETVRDTVAQVKRVGLPVGTLVGVAVLGFLFARRM